MIEKQEMTWHMKKDRINRAVFIAMTVGFGNVVHTKYCKESNTYSYLTDTGVIIIKDPKDVIITMYLANVAQAYAVSGGQLSKALLKIVQKNIAKNYLKLQDRG